MHMITRLKNNNYTWLATALLGFVLFAAIVITPVFAQNVSPEIAEPVQPVEQSKDIYVHAKVLEIVSESQELIPSTDTEMLFQELRVKFTRGELKGQEATFINDYIPLKKGQGFIARVVIHSNGDREYVVSDLERRPLLAVLLALFLGAVIIFGRMQGIRSLISLGVSILVIFFFLIPMLLKGYHPVLLSTVTAMLVLFLRFSLRMDLIVNH